MRQLFFILIVAGGAAYYFQDELFNDYSIPCVKPDDFPDWLDWDCNKQKAYNEGKVYFNKDSSVFAFATDHTPFDSSRMVSVNLGHLTK